MNFYWPFPASVVTSARRVIRSGSWNSDSGFVSMKVISAIENEEVIKKILKHLGLWHVKTRPPPRKEKLPGIIETPMDFSASQLPQSEEHLYFDVEYPVEDPDFNEEAASFNF